MCSPRRKNLHNREESVTVLPLLLLVASITHPSNIVQCVDLIEINHVHCGKGLRLFSQIIFWDINPATKKFFVREWHMVDRVFDLQFRRQGTSVVLKDGLVVLGKMFRESWSHNDPERIDLQTNYERLPLVRPKPLVTIDVKGMFDH